MHNTFDTVDIKIAETEFFLAQMAEAGFDWFVVQCHFSAFLAASRTITLALQRFRHVPDFDDWYGTQQVRLRSDPYAAFFLELRNDHLHGGPYPIQTGTVKGGEVEFHFAQSLSKPDFRPVDVVRACRRYFVLLLEVVYSCYENLGVHIDPQQHYTKEHFAKIGRTISDAEIEITGLIFESLVEDGFTDDDRWHSLRGRVGECQINHLFKSYLSKVTPQPPEPEHFRDFEYSDKDRGWHYIPGGYESIGDYTADRKQFGGESED